LYTSNQSTFFSQCLLFVGFAGTKDVVLFRIGVAMQIGVALSFVSGIYKVRYDLIFMSKLRLCGSF